MVTLPYLWIYSHFKCILELCLHRFTPNPKCLPKDSWECGRGDDVTVSLTLGYFSELCLRVRALVSVRMVLEGQLVEGLLDLALGGISGHTQDFIVVLFGQDELGDEQDVDSEQ